ncbi:hypothetical protein ACFSO7_13115 [Bacillus sp. CGMCC 1.16607]|uniref:hypothetical protein n=1 Tax=Bacillus sp. CGMCC 1.16607 TaxID=3351842 RepID=UPI003638A790
MGFGFRENRRDDCENKIEHKGVNHGENRSNIGNNSIVNFLRTLSPGIQVELQYDCQPPACGTFQGFEHGNVILTNFNGFPGLVRIAPNRINAVAPFGCGHGHH